MKIEQIEKKAASALAACFADVPFVQNIVSLESGMDKGPQYDVALRLRTSESEKLIVAEVRRSGQPRYAREAASQLLRHLPNMPETYGVFVAPYIAENAAKICEEAGIGYVDLAGNCRIVFDRIYIEREGRSNRFSEQRELRSLYAPKASRVLRVLLARPQGRWKMQDLADEANVSLGHTSNVKQALLDREWAKETSSGFYLEKPEALLKEWVENYRVRKSKSNRFYALDPVGSIEDRLESVCRRMALNETEIAGPLYALTSFSGAERLAPHVRYQRATAYVRGSVDLQLLAEELGLKSVTSGANVELLEPYDAGVFYAAECIGGLWVAHPVQVYLDLRTQRDRGEEAATFLYNEIIKPAWQQERE